MKPYQILLLSSFLLSACASSDPPGPEGTGDHKAGYLLGRSDAAKQQYWITQSFQKGPKPVPERVTYLPITIPGQTINGVTTVPHTEKLRIEDGQ